MQDGFTASLNLLSHSQINGITYYKFDVFLNGKVYSWQERYSELRRMFEYFPQATVKFPARNSIGQAISRITHSQRFLSERFNLMKEYFQSINGSHKLQSYQAFLKLVNNLDKESTINQQERYQIQGPIIKGRKLSVRTQASQRDLYLIV